MKSFKVLTAFLLTPVLIFSSLTSPGVLAQEKLIETVPKFYYLEQPEGGESVHVHVCYNGSTPLNPDCETVVEVAATDLEKFVHDLEHKVSVAKALTVVEHKSQRARGKVLDGFIVVNNSVGFLTSLLRFSRVFAKDPYVVRHSSAIWGITGMAFFLTYGIGAWGYLTKAEEEVTFPLSSEQGLLNALDRGIVAGEEYLDLQVEIMQLFTDFLNEFGRSIQ